MGKSCSGTVPPTMRYEGEVLVTRLRVVLRKLDRAQKQRPNTSQREAILILREVLGIESTPDSHEGHRDRHEVTRHR